MPTNDLPPMVPRPKQIEYFEGETEFSDNIRLSTSNVLPFIRKTMRAVLNNANIRVVANKKRFVITVNIVDEEKVNLADVPEWAYDDFYELEVRDNFITIDTPRQLGSVWGLQTFVDIYAKVGPGNTIPNFKIRDWADMPYRGVFLQPIWGTDRMKENDWNAFFERLTALRLNVLGVNLCGSPCPENPAASPETVMLPPDPQEEEPEGDLINEQKWYFPRKKRVVTDEYIPPYVEKNFFQELISLATEKGIYFVPSLRINKTLFSVLRNRLDVGLEGPKYEIEAGPVSPDELTSEANRKNLNSFLDEFLTNYLSQGLNFFHLDLRDFTERTERGEPLADFVAWFVSTVTEKGVKRVLLRDSSLSTTATDFADLLEKKLQEKDLLESVVLHTTWENARKRDELGCAAPPFNTPNASLEWVAPNIAQNNWEPGVSRIEELYNAITWCRSNNVQAVVADTVTDTTWLDHEHLLAFYGWNFQNPSADLEEAYGECLQVAFGNGKDAVCTARERITEAIENYSAMRMCLELPALGTEEEDLSNYPAGILEQLHGLGTDESIEQLQGAHKTVAEAISRLEELKESEELQEEFKYPHYYFIAALYAEGLRIQCLAKTFEVLVTLYEADQQGKMPENAQEQLKKAAENMQESFDSIGKQKKLFAAAPFIQHLTPLMEFVDQLQEQLKPTKKKKQKPLQWGVSG